MEKEIVLTGDLDNVIDQLLEYKSNGIDVYCNYNGCILHSKDITIDKAYLAVTGYTQLEYLKQQKKYLNSLKQEKVNTWYIEGLNYIYPQKNEQWLEYCKKQESSPAYTANIITEVLSFMRLIESSNNLEEITQEFKDKNYSGYTATMIQDALLNYSKRGPEFIRILFKNDLKDMPSFTKEIEQIEKENESFNIKNDSIEKNK